MIKETPPCPTCGEPLILVEHYEYDGVTPNGSYEPYYECINKCNLDEE